jgi:hypothetical protein
MCPSSQNMQCQGFALMHPIDLGDKNVSMGFQKLSPM